MRFAANLVTKSIRLDLLWAKFHTLCYYYTIFYCAGIGSHGKGAL
jgi:hypothetical protein